MSQTASAARRVFAGSRRQLALGQVLTVRLSPDVAGMPREAIVLADASGVIHAYLNRCRHLPIPLDAGSRRFLVEGQLECATHGARYRSEDGLCIRGPCRGQSLTRLELQIADDDVFVVES